MAAWEQKIWEGTVDGLLLRHPDACVAAAGQPLCTLAQPHGVGLHTTLAAYHKCIRQLQQQRAVWLWAKAADETKARACLWGRYAAQAGATGKEACGPGTGRSQRHG